MDSRIGTSGAETVALDVVRVVLHSHWGRPPNDGTRRPGRGLGALLDLPVPRSGAGICVSNRDGL